MIRIASALQRKYLLIHEMGHLIAEFVANGVPMNANCTDDDHPDGGPCNDAPGNSHAFWSREFDKCAFGEAFADFYAADVWNDHNEDNCAFRYFITNEYTIGAPFAAFDCAGDDGADPDLIPNDFTAYYSEAQVPYIAQCTTVAPPPNNYSGRGNELDWTRVFWNLHTDGSSPPSYTTIVRWVRDCPNVGGSNAYSALDACAQARGSTDPLRLNWDVAKNVHAIDYSY